MNPIQNVFQARIDALIAQSNGAKAFEHSTTKGSLREIYLIDFFRELIPQSLSITSGLICDASGRCSQQIDFIIKDDNTLPSVNMMETVSLVPVESVHLTAEIKSTLQTKDLKQVEESRKIFDSLQLATVSDDTQPPIKIPTVILAYENKVSQDTLKNWMAKNGSVVAICVIGKFSIAKENNSITLYESRKDKPKHWETMVFASQLHDWLLTSIAIPRGRPLWDCYLLGVERVSSGSQDS